VRATGFPEASTCASAARNSALIADVECLRKIRSYSLHVSEGCLSSVPLTGKNSSVGFLIT
jgi:hypothetical protein